jgi:hypothetical protein
LTQESLRLTSRALILDRWKLLAPVLDQLFNGTSWVSRTTFTSAQKAISAFCTDLTVEIAAFPVKCLPGKELYDSLLAYMKQHTNQDWISSYMPRENDEDFLRAYNKRWKRYKDAATKTAELFIPLEDKWIKPNKAELVLPCLVLLWQQSFSQDLQTRLVKALLYFITGQRERMRIPQPPKVKTTEDQDSNSSDTKFYTDAAAAPQSSPFCTEQLPLIQSVINSITLLSNPKIIHEHYISRFEEKLTKDFVEKTDSFYRLELDQFQKHPGMPSVGRIHWVLNRITLEKDFLPDHYYLRVFYPTLETVHDAVYSGNLASYFLNFTEHENLPGEPLVVAAGQSAQDEMVRLLTKGKDGINDVDDYGRTALHSAVLANNITLLDSLIQLGAHSNVQDQEGQTAGHLAVITKNLEALNSLFSLSAGFSVRNHQQETIGDLVMFILIEKYTPDWWKAYELARELEQDVWLFDKPLDGAADSEDLQPTLTRYKSGIYKPSSQTHALQDLLCDDSEYQAQMGDDANLKWLHFPANNVSKGHLRGIVHAMLIILPDEMDRGRSHALYL